MSTGLLADGFQQAATISLKDFILFAEKVLHTTANVELDKQIQLGNDTYATFIDGRPAVGRSAIPTAKYKVRFNFLAASVTLAIDIMRQELERAIRRTTIKRTGHLSNAISIYYGSADGSFVNVSNVNEITHFKAGDYVALVPETEYAGVVNHWVRQHGKRGFMGQAAQRIRRAVGSSTARGAVGISVSARFSMSLAERLVTGSSRLKGYGLPYIRIGLKRQQFGFVGGRQ
jgi:hypothetical protein